MGRKLPLPLLNLGRDPGSPAPGAARRPTADEVRARLGGRASTGPGAGELVMLTTPGGEELPGVVLFTAGDVVDVWLERPPTGASPSGAGIVRRTNRNTLVPLPPPVPRQLAAIAADACVFGALSEGQRIQYQTDAGLGEGLLVEKCRYGALVQQDQGGLLAVGFRRLWPARPEDHADN
ncbi:hypothetical protein [Chondromyces crocatus]|uniref:Uncharacterized protein n=1 Tax=Chondromyces crocatus TaxID=52 RepID=A0A0K1EGN2_CHOCO|nr:hypothetical protein [Chondromyces crocatus]AKT39743.1 uncharacterized protein CMC5_038940 [Chondromyces crocatus]